MDVNDIGKLSIPTRICKMFTFHAAHQLPNHRGLCKNLHGHTYKVEIEVEGEISLEEGTSEHNMVCDFDEIKLTYIKNVHAYLDHKNLNDVLPFRTTAENIAHWIFQTMEEHLSHGDVSRVRVWETENSWAEVTYEFATSKSE